MFEAKLSALRFSSRFSVYYYHSQGGATFRLPDLTASAECYSCGVVRGPTLYLLTCQLFADVADKEYNLNYGKIRWRFMTYNECVVNQLTSSEWNYCLVLFLVYLFSFRVAAMCFGEIKLHIIMGPTVPASTAEQRRSAQATTVGLSSPHCLTKPDPQ